MAEREGGRPRCGRGLRPSVPKETVLPRERVPPTPGQDSDPRLPQVLAKAGWVWPLARPTWAGSPNLNLPSSLAWVVDLCGRRTHRKPLEDYLGWNIIHGAEQVLPKCVLQGRTNASAGVGRGQIVA